MTKWKLVAPGCKTRFFTGAARDIRPAMYRYAADNGISGEAVSCFKA